MAIIRIVLRKEERPNGTFPLAIRINKSGKVSFIYLDYAIKTADWDKKAQLVKKSNPNHKFLNNYLRKKISDATDCSLTVETHKPHASVKAIRQKIKPSAGETFFAQADSYIDHLKQSKKFNIYSADRSRIEKFREFLKGQDIAFSDITVGLLEKFKAYMKGTKGKRVKYVSDRTIVNHLVVIRSVYAHARKNNIAIPEEHYPFGKGKIQIKFPPSKKIGLDIQEVRLLENADLADKPKLDHARNVWLTAFYFAGTRVGDTLMLRWSNFQNGRLYYKMQKNDKDDSLKLPEQAMRIIEKYRRPNPKHDLVFPELEPVDDINDDWEVQRRIKTCIRQLNEYLLDLADYLGIEKKLTMHIARHTFGNLSGSKIPIQTLQKLYRHTHISTTINYQQNFIHEEMDAALEKVLNP